MTTRTSRSFDDILAEVRWSKAAWGTSTFGAMSGALEKEEWDEFLEHIERLQRFWKMHADNPL